MKKGLPVTLMLFSCTSYYQSHFTLQQQHQMGHLVCFNMYSKASEFRCEFEWINHDVYPSCLTLSPHEESRGPREYLFVLGHRGVGLSAGSFVVFWSFPVWHVPGRVLLFTLHSSEYSPPCCLFSCATTPEECAPGESDTEEHCDHYTDVGKTQMEMLPLLLSIRGCVLYYVVNLMCKNTGLLFCLNVLDYFIFYFAYFIHIITGQQHSGGFWNEAHGRPVGHTQFEACVEISSVPKGGVVGFPNTVIEWDPSDALLSHFFLPHTALRFLLSNLLLVISYYAYRPFI